jgi:RNA polymerase sigma factor (sigma-70 family)
MASGQLNTLLRLVHRHVGVDGGLADAELLRRFVSTRDESAFELLVWRHGVMVLGVCRRVLRHEQDIEDAFQATFLALLRGAGSISKQESVSSWLFKVAHRVALRARTDSTRRAQRERRAAIPEAVEVAAGTETVWRDLQPVLDDELARLPAIYRTCFLLCCVEGRTVEQAAHELGCPRSTVGNRLARARARLRARLTRRGVSLPAALLSAVFCKEAAAELPVPLVVSILEVATDPVRSARLADLTQGVLSTMSPLRTTLAAALGLAATLLAVGAVLFAQPPRTAPPPIPFVSASTSGPTKDSKQRADALGDPLPPGALLRFGTVRFRQRNVTVVTFSSDGSILIAGDRDGGIRFWDRSQGTEFRRLSAHRGAVTAIALSSDRTLLASAGQDHVIRLWNAATGKEVGTFTGHEGEVVSVVFTPDDRTLISAGQDRTIRLWEVATRKELRRWPENPGPISSLALSPDGQTLALASSERDPKTGLGRPIRLLSVATGKEAGELPGHDGVTHAIRFSSDGKTLAATSTDLVVVKGNGNQRVHYTPALRLWDLATSKQRQRWELPGTDGLRVAFAPDGRSLAVVVLSTTRAEVSPTFTIRVLDTESGKEVKRLGTSFFLVPDLAFSPDGQTLAAAGSCLGVWDPGTGQRLQQQDSHREQVTAVAFAPTGRTLFSASDDTTVRAWDLASGKPTQQFLGHEGLVRCLAVAPDGKSLVTGGGTLSNSRENRTLRLWDTTTGNEREWAQKGPGLVTSVAFSTDGRMVVSTGALLNSLERTIGQVVQFWDLKTGKESRSIPLTGGGAYSLALAPDARTLATAGGTKEKDHAIRVWDAETSKERIRCVGHQDTVQALAFSGDGVHLASASSDGTVRVWLAANGKESRLLAGHEGAVFAVAFTPDGRNLVSGGKDNTVRLWDLATGQEVHRWTGHAAAVRSVAVSPDGAFLASGSTDSTILVWDLKAVRK